jgi:hypothetical protein
LSSEGVARGFAVLKNRDFTLYLGASFGGHRDEPCCTATVLVTVLWARVFSPSPWRMQTSEQQ